MWNLFASKNKLSFPHRDNWVLFCSFEDERESPRPFRQVLFFLGTALRDPRFTAPKPSDLRHPGCSAESRWTWAWRMSFDFLAKGELVCTGTGSCSSILLMHSRGSAPVYSTSHSSQVWWMNWASTWTRDSKLQGPSAHPTSNFSSYKPCLPFRLKQIERLYYQHRPAIPSQRSVSFFTIFPQSLYLFTDLVFPRSFRRRIPHGITHSSGSHGARIDSFWKTNLNYLFLKPTWLSLRVWAALAVKQTHFWGY